MEILLKKTSEIVMALVEGGFLAPLSTMLPALVVAVGNSELKRSS